MVMIKHVILLLLLSAAIVFGMPYLQHGVQFLLTVHDWISQALTAVFSAGTTGNVLRSLIALLSVPVIIALVPTIIYWIIRRHWFPYFMEIVWVVWLIQAGALGIANKSTAAETTKAAVASVAAAVGAT